MALLSMLPRICKSPYVMTPNNLRNGSLLTTVIEAHQASAEAEAEQQEIDDDNDTQQGPRTLRNIASRHGQDDDSDVEAPQPPRTGKRNRPMTAKAQLLQAAANDRNDRAAAASEVKQARERSKRARHLARQL
ncbi:hypothetical protein BCR37DRAFT_386749 [Protomyces lactucae-debilis]|uniref:Uncharacterized protein n=1 Tax=Protomyces lactucae-debilis TaxID=2754530 RepID=A0A1Y2FK23_PROLT|nr:uncharacterized protein BCR37DRAFT_386749 [Protomyces lactucae-debilis]ORY83724.1 hypothetical protein BCR37DRAFT_386749 [Protomyces lactucae-debilis]